MIHLCHGIGETLHVAKHPPSAQYSANAFRVVFHITIGRDRTQCLWNLLSFFHRVRPGPVVSVRDQQQSIGCIRMLSKTPRQTITNNQLSVKIKDLPIIYWLSSYCDLFEHFFRSGWYFWQPFLSVSFDSFLKRRITKRGDELNIKIQNWLLTNSAEEFVRHQTNK